MQRELKPQLSGGLDLYAKSLFYFDLNAKSLSVLTHTLSHFFSVLNYNPNHFSILTSTLNHIKSPACFLFLF